MASIEENIEGIRTDSIIQGALYMAMALRRKGRLLDMSEAELVALAEEVGAAEKVVRESRKKGIDKSRALC
jgi:hypothetical protein